MLIESLFVISFFVTFSAILKLGLDYHVVTGGGNRSTRESQCLTSSDRQLFHMPRSGFEPGQLWETASSQCNILDHAAIRAAPMLIQYSMHGNVTWREIVNDDCLWDFIHTSHTCMSLYCIKTLMLYSKWITIYYIMSYNWAQNKNMSHPATTMLCQLEWTSTGSDADLFL